MASWTRSALALLTGMSGAHKLVEAACTDAVRIAACHVQAWAQLCKQWTRSAIRHAQNLSQAARKMVELTAEGLHVSGHHVHRWVSHTEEDMLSQSTEWLTPEPVCASAKMSVPCQQYWPSMPAILAIGMCGMLPAWASTCARIPQAPPPASMCHIM